MKRKDFLTLSAIAAGTGTLAGMNAYASPKKDQDMNTLLDNLQPMTEGVQPITVAERQERIKKAQRLLKEAGMAALVLDSGTTMNYFTGLRWGRSERTMVAVIPAQGEVSYVCPGFEEATDAGTDQNRQTGVRVAGRRKSVAANREGHQ